jgi:hypothetical protein
MSEKYFNPNYFGEVGQAQGGAAGLQGGNGLHLRENAKTDLALKYFEIYDKYTNAINALSDLMINDYSRFKQTAQGFVELDANGAAAVESASGSKTAGNAKYEQIGKGEPKTSEKKSPFKTEKPVYGPHP